MKFDIVQPIRISVRIIKLFGLWRLDNKYNSLYRVFTYFLHISTTLLTTSLMLMNVIHAENFEQFANPLFMTLTMIALCIKVANILNLNKVAVNFVKFLKTFRVKSPEELKIFKHSQRIFYIVVIVYTSASFAVFVFGFTVITLGKKWILPFPTWLPFEYQYDSMYYWFAYFYQFFGMLQACLSNVSLDMLQCYYLQSISLIYCVIGHRLATIGYNLKDVSDNSEVDKVILEEIKEIIKVHNFAKKLTVDCERLLSFPIFMQVLVSAFVLCFTGYRLSSMSILDDPVRFIEMIDYLFVMGLQIYLPCHYGNQITLEAGKLNEALYSSNWTPLPRKSKRTIYLYMEFLKEPVYVMAGKFFPIGLSTFAKTLNNAYSFFAVLIRMKN